jgi:cysteine desulfurase
MEHDAEHSARLRDRFEKRIFEALEHVYVNGDPERRLPGCSNLSFSYVEGESLMMGIKDIAVSSGSACTSASLEPSHVLQSMEVGDELAHSSIRFGFGRLTTEEEADYAAEHVIEAVNRLRELSPLYEMVKEGIDLSTVHWQAEH